MKEWQPVKSRVSGMQLPWLSDAIQQASDKARSLINHHHNNDPNQILAVNWKTMADEIQVYVKAKGGCGKHRPQVLIAVKIETDNGASAGRMQPPWSFNRSLILLCCRLRNSGSDSGSQQTSTLPVQLELCTLSRPEPASEPGN